MITLCQTGKVGGQSRGPGKGFWELLVPSQEGSLTMTFTRAVPWPCSKPSSGHPPSYLGVHALRQHHSGETEARRGGEPRPRPSGSCGAEETPALEPGAQGPRRSTWRREGRSAHRSPWSMFWKPEVRWAE